MVGGGGVVVTARGAGVFSIVEFAFLFWLAMTAEWMDGVG